MKIGVGNLLHFKAGRTFATGISLTFVAAKNILCISKSEGKVTTACRTQEQLGMADTVIIYGLYQPPFYVFLTYDFFE